MNLGDHSDVESIRLRRTSSTYVPTNIDIGTLLIAIDVRDDRYDEMKLGISAAVFVVGFTVLMLVFLF